MAEDRDLLGFRREQVISAQLPIAAAIPARTVSLTGGIAPDCEANHAPQRFPASLSVSRSAPRSM
jgi:hypothetical protein